MREQGLDCPFDVFVQVFHEHFGRSDVPALTAAVDWSAVSWTEETLSGDALRQVYVDRRFARAVDEARVLTREEGLYDERLAVVAAWQRQQTWAVAPVLLSGNVTGNGHRYDLLVGNSRLGNLLGLLDRGDVPDTLRHRVWVGSIIAREAP